MRGTGLDGHGVHKNYSQKDRKWNYDKDHSKANKQYAQKQALELKREIQRIAQVKADRAEANRIEAAKFAEIARIAQARKDAALAKQKEADAAQKNKLTNPTGGGIRADSEGNGSFGAPRGNRKHLGIDLTTINGQYIVSPVDGKAVNFVGASTKYPIVDITPSNQSLGIDKIRILYVDAPAGTKSWSSYSVSAGGRVGRAANLQGLDYSSGVTPHVHLQIMSGGQWVDPTPYFFSP